MILKKMLYFTLFLVILQVVAMNWNTYHVEPLCVEEVSLWVFFFTRLNNLLHWYTVNFSLLSYKPVCNLLLMLQRSKKKFCV